MTDVPASSGVNSDIISAISTLKTDVENLINSAPNPAKDPKSLSGVVVSGSLLGALINNSTFENLDYNASAYNRVRQSDVNFTPNHVGTSTTKHTLLNVTGGGWFYGAISRQMNTAGTVTWTLTVDGVETVLKTRSTGVSTRHIIGRLMKSYSDKFIAAAVPDQLESIRFDSSFKLEVQHSTEGADSTYTKYCYYRYERD